jgi:hypothetical protein
MSGQAVEFPREQRNDDQTGILSPSLQRGNATLKTSKPERTIPMSKITSLATAVVVLVAAVSATSAASAQSSSAAKSARMQMSQAQAQQARMMKAQAAKAQAAKAGMAAAVVTAATLAATDAGECSPYLAKWMMTRSPAWKAAYDMCMDD